jgi:hypothetical protein
MRADVAEEIITSIFRVENQTRRKPEVRILPSYLLQAGFLLG